MRKMKDKKLKKLKKWKKVHVLPHVILLSLFICAFVVPVMIFESSLIVFMIDSELVGMDNEANRIVSILDAQKGFDDNTIKLSFDAAGTKPFVVCDADENVLATYGDAKFNKSDLMLFSENDINVYFDRKITSSDYMSEQKFHSIKMIVDYFDHGVKLDSKSLQNVAYEFPGWIKKPIKEGKYYIYYQANITLTNKDMIYLVLIFGFTVMMAVIPLILYTVTFIISIKAQRRNALIFHLDPETGGKNWVYFKERVEYLLKKNRRKRKYQYAMVSTRMDKYQSYCMCYGNQEGKVLLGKISKVLSEYVGKKETVARYAEVEFGMLLLFDSEEQLTYRLKQIREELIPCADGRNIDFSCGICDVYAIDEFRNIAKKEIEAKVDSLYSNASVARKTITGESVSRIAWFNASLKSEQLWEHYVAEHMEQALADGEFHVYIQPKYGAKSHKLGGGEALIRWASPTEGLISPMKFIPIFEQNGFINKIDDYMIKSVATLQANWIKEGKNVVPISVNVSRTHFTQVDLAEHICRIVEETGAPKNMIELELTESAFFHDKDVLVNTVAKLREYGFKVSMDDFGADYSSLNSLKDLQLDVIKLDAGFFRGKEESGERGSVIVAEVIQLAKNLNMQIVAEGIESANQVEFLANNGCDLIQGFYFAKPMAVADYEKVQDEAQQDEAQQDEAQQMVEEVK